MKITFAAALAAFLAAAAAFAPPIRATDEPRADLSLALARVAANEAFGSPTDLRLIWQITRSRARSPGARLAWLRAHSPCATGVLSQEQADLRRGNCSWARNLDRSLDEPAGWPENAPPWAPRYRRTWRETLRAARVCVLGGPCPAPCEVTPRTWGDPILDGERARRNGLVPLRCEQATRNTPYARARDVSRETS